MRIVKAVKRWEVLSRQFNIPKAKDDRIRKTLSDETEQRVQSITYWINHDPLASWRRLITALDEIGETQLANTIRVNAEILTGTEEYVFG